MLDELLERWRAEAAYLEGRGLKESSRLVLTMSDELEAVLRALGDESVNLTDAAAISGYCSDHLGNLIREGKIKNVGKKHAPRIRLRDLPRKAGHGSVAGDVSVLRLDAARRRRDALEEAKSGRRAGSPRVDLEAAGLAQPVSQVGG